MQAENQNQLLEEQRKKPQMERLKLALKEVSDRFLPHAFMIYHNRYAPSKKGFVYFQMPTLCLLEKGMRPDSKRMCEKADSGGLHSCIASNCSVESGDFLFKISIGYGEPTHELMSIEFYVCCKIEYGGINSEVLRYTCKLKDMGCSFDMRPEFVRMLNHEFTSQSLLSFIGALVECSADDHSFVKPVVQKMQELAADECYWYCL